MIKEASRCFFGINDCEEQADQVADTLQGKIYSNSDSRVITNDYERLTDQVEVETSSQCSRMKLSSIAEETEVKGHHQYDIEPEASDNQWAEEESPNLTLLKGQLWISHHEIVWSVSEP